MKKVKHGQKFYYINTELFHYKYSDEQKKQTGETYKLIGYEWVIPMYVYSTCKVWNGDERFDISPIKFDENSKNDDWKWKFECKYEEISKKIFNTEAEAWKVYNRKYTPEKIKVNKENRRLRFLQESKASLI